ncbi:MAG: hypothetical protein KatS3mg063_1408 [Tepidiforma sp.]|uniref:hypothetical protein n=1 Tax=Tepidiforma sp. TaxID=2682230 RepID=UPI0021DE0BE0|nr:hypothetical protein [Tepidiforma sp.]GIW12572.1 MAG: hypothetical protein KatS3mg062_0011 [Tepidiforma sp.]GIW15555.1 MAG: hypothetical protein KatS3mg063_1408 [Tepidiforma sp.]
MGSVVQDLQLYYQKRDALLAQYDAAMARRDVGEVTRLLMETAEAVERFQLERGRAPRPAPEEQKRLAEKAARAAQAGTWNRLAELNARLSGIPIVAARCQQCFRSLGLLAVCGGMPHLTFRTIPQHGYPCSNCDPDAPFREGGPYWSPFSLLGAPGKSHTYPRGFLVCHRRCRTATGGRTTYLVDLRRDLFVFRAALESGVTELWLGRDLAR